MGGEAFRALGLRGTDVVAVPGDIDALDDLVRPGTVEVGARDLTPLPAFDDAHEHLMEASRNTMLVPVDRARSVEEFLGMVRDAANNSARGIGS
jgi:predicted amidohydrolase YtcJ